MARAFERVRAGLTERAVMTARRIGWLVPRIYFDLSRDYRDTVLLVGSGRSGTSWIPEVLNFDRRYRYLYEPFHSMHVPLARHWLPRQYKRPDDDDAGHLALARAIFTGRLRNGYADSQNHCLVAHKRLVKDTRLQLALAWVARHFPGMPIIYLMRHPCAVVNSRVQLQRNSDIAKHLLSQPFLMADHLEPFRKEMERAKDDFEAQLFIWCVENYVPLKQLRSTEVHLLFYERICTDPRGELARLSAYLQQPFDELALAALDKPSVQARKYHGGGTSAIVTGASLVDAWRQYVPADRVKRAVEILSMFGLDAIYAEDSMPHVEAADAMLAGP